ncbi:MAG: 2-C-methyl-D-erythritol 2,4-cyclodiphosphate synthase [Idiomarina sp.]
MRIGHGYDVHKFGSEQPLILGGITVPHNTGLVAHSDGDVVLHAVADALLGSLALGDIGQHFPDTDAKFKGADSAVLLQHVFGLLRERGWQLGNLDVTIVAQAPKMAPYIGQMRERIASLLEAEVDQVNVKATTTERLGFVGREEGIACHSVALITKRLVV